MSKVKAILFELRRNRGCQWHTKLRFIVIFLLLNKYSSWLTFKLICGLIYVVTTTISRYLVHFKPLEFYLAITILVGILLTISNLKDSSPKILKCSAGILVRIGPYCRWLVVQCDEIGRGFFE